MHAASSSSNRTDRRSWSNAGSSTPTFGAVRVVVHDVQLPIDSHEVFVERLAGFDR